MVNTQLNINVILLLAHCALLACFKISFLFKALARLIIKKVKLIDTSNI